MAIDDSSAGGTFTTEAATDAAWDEIGLVPPRRLGTMLSKARSAQGMTLAEVAERADGGFSMGQLASIERGTVSLNDDGLRNVVSLYRIEAGTLIPDRSQLVVDLDEGLLRVADTERQLDVGSIRPGAPISAATRHDVLSRYLSMVYTMRELTPGSKLSLRVEDLDVLGTTLRVGTSALNADLVALMAEADGSVAWRTQLLRRRVLIPAAGILVAFCGASALLLVQGDVGTPAGAETPPAVVTTAAPSSGAVLGPATVQVRNADGSAGPVTDR